MKVMLILTHSKWWLRGLRSNFCCRLWVSVLLKLWRHLVLTRSIMRMLTIWSSSYSSIDLMSSNMSTWSTIVIGNMMINTAVGVVLRNLFGSRTWSWRTIYRILMTTSTRLLFLAHNATVTRMLYTLWLIWLIPRRIGRFLSDRLIRINRRCMLTMGRWMASGSHIGLLFFNVSDVFIRVVRLVLVVLVVASSPNSITRGWWYLLLSIVLRCLLLIFH